MSKLNLPTDQVQVLGQLHLKERSRRVRERPSDFFPWHRIQQWVMDVATQVVGDVRMVFIAGGNRGGKSATMKGILSQIVRRTSPLNAQFLTQDKLTGKIRVKNRKDPITIWVVPPTLEKARQDWLTPQDGYGLKHWLGDLYVDMRQTPDLVLYSRPPGLAIERATTKGGEPNVDVLDKILIKSQDQKLETFESSEVDAILIDEELHDEAIWNSCRMRVGTTHGVIVMGFTPLRGLTWTYKKFWKKYVEDGQAKKLAERCWVYQSETGGANIVFAQIGSADNPRAAVYAKEIEQDPSMGEAEKSSRLYGKYGYVEGALVPALAGLDIASPTKDQEVYVLDELPKQLSHWFLVADPNKSYGAVLSTVDYDGNLIFVAEHLEESWPDRKHADAFKRMKTDFVTGTVHEYADPGGAGAHSIVNMASLGVNFQTMPKGAGSVSTSVKKLRGMAFVDPKHRHPITKEKGAPRLYFYRKGLLGPEKTECKLASQISQARQSQNENAPPDTPHKDIRNRLDLFDCGRYTAVLMDEILAQQESPSAGIGVNLENTLKRMPLEQSFDPLQMEYWLPEYDFSPSFLG